MTEATNLHFHGLHVPPTGTADNSFLEVGPGESITYELPIPADHPSGMFWYHPHRHGTTAHQVSSGLAGVMLIRGEFDDQPEIRDTPEFLVILQDFEMAADGRLMEPNQMERSRGREGRLVTVSGEENPRIPLVADGWTRLRLLNASASRFYRLGLEGHRFTVVGIDGGLLAAPAEMEELLLVPGQRADVFVAGQAREGTFRLLNMPYDRFGGMDRMRRAPLDAPMVLATFEYSGSSGDPWPMPLRLRNIDSLPAPEVRRTFRFGMGMGMGMGMTRGGLTINGRMFDPDRVDTTVRLNSVEDWDLVNASAMDHPFHIHTNAFQIVGADGDAERIWRDVVLVRAWDTVRIRIRFSDYTGKAMYHCHILDHEDMGMMGTVAVVP